jgi:hypothetical protein
VVTIPDEMSLQKVVVRMKDVSQLLLPFALVMFVMAGCDDWQGEVGDGFTEPSWDTGDPAGDLTPDTGMPDSPFWAGSTCSVQFDWLVNGEAADSTSCADAGGAEVWMSVTEYSDDWAWYDEFKWPCDVGSADTGYIFGEGRFYFGWQLVDETDTPLSRTESYLGIIVPDMNDIGTVDFVTAD